MRNVALRPRVDPVALIAAIALTIALLEPFLILVVGPRLTRRMINRDLDAIVREKIHPLIVEAVTNGSKPVLEATAAAAASAKEAVAGSVPVIIATVRQSTEPVLQALEAAKEAAVQAREAMDQQEGSDAARLLQGRSVEARNEFAMREEAVVAAIMSQAGPVGAILAEEAKARFRQHWKALVRAGPDAVPQFLQQASTLMPGLKIPAIAAGSANGAGFL